MRVTSPTEHIKFCDYEPLKCISKSYKTFLTLQPWVSLGCVHKTSLTASILSPIVHPKCGQVAIHLALPFDAWTQLLPLSTHGFRIKEAFRWPNQRICLIFMRLTIRVSISP